jgi:hypothetical protein
VKAPALSTDCPEHSGAIAEVDIDTDDVLAISPVMLCDRSGVVEARSVVERSDPDENQADAELDSGETENVELDVVVEPRSVD